MARVAIDAPFGWPAPFVEAVTTYQREGRWGEPSPLELLALRVTDRAVKGGPGPRPLSVSSDRLASTAFRCARLLTMVSAPVDRSGAGRIAETYPAAVMRAWRIDPALTKGYKRSGDAVAIRKRLLQAILDASGLRPAVDTDALTASDHVLDAFVCALLAHLLETSRTDAVPAGLEDLASAEGWIHLPAADALERLA